MLLGGRLTYRFGLEPSLRHLTYGSGDAFGMQFRIGFHRGVKVYVPPPPAVAACRPPRRRHRRRRPRRPRPPRRQSWAVGPRPLRTLHDLAGRHRQRCAPRAAIPTATP